MNEKRRPIQRQMNKIVLAIVAAAILLVSAAAVITMQHIRETSRTALVDRMETRLRETVENKSDLANEVLNSYADRVYMFVECAEDMYAHPEQYQPRDVLPPRPEMGGKPVMERTLASEDISVDDLHDEICLLGNLEPLFKSITESEDTNITDIYIGTVSGALLSYTDVNYLGEVPEQGEFCYEYRQAGWYQTAVKEDRLIFTDIYYDHYGRGSMISCACPVYRDGELAAVVCLDIKNQDLQGDILSMSLPEGSYAFLLDSQRKVVADTRGITEISLDDGRHGDKDVQEAICSGGTDVCLSADGTYYAYAPVQSNGWTLCIAAPRDSVLRPLDGLDQDIQNALFAFLAILLGIIGAAIVAVRLFAKQITHPLSELQKDAEIISGGNLDWQAKVLHNDEVGDLARSFNNMTKSLRTYIDDLTRVTAQTERIGAELDVATRIQNDMLPGVFPAFPNHNEFDLYAVMTPAREVGGDFYDFFMLDDDHLALVIADVSGKGVPAALFMVISKTLIKNRAMLGGSPAEILADVNNQLCEGNDADMFVTCWLGILEISTGRIVAANAGHEFPAVCGKDRKFDLFRDKHGFVLAAMEGARYRDYEIRLTRGGSIFVYTDGVPEAANADGGMFGSERMLSALNACEDNAPEAFLGEVSNAVKTFAGDAPQFDDVTMVGLTWHGRNADTAE